MVAKLLHIKCSQTVHKNTRTHTWTLSNTRAHTLLIWKRTIINNIKKHIWVGGWVRIAFFPMIIDWMEEMCWCRHIHTSKRKNEKSSCLVDDTRNSVTVKRTISKINWLQVCIAWSMGMLFFLFTNCYMFIYWSANVGAWRNKKRAVDEIQIDLVDWNPYKSHGKVIKLIE